MLAILYQETGVAYSCNSPPSLRGRPSASLLDRGFKRVAGVPTTYINLLLFLSRLQLLSSANFLLCSRSSVLPRRVSAPAPLLVTLVAISYLLLLKAFCTLPVSESLLLYTCSIVGVILSPYLEI
jgi:hypothetical protein